MKKFLKLSAVAGLLVSMSACQKEYEAPKSPVVEMSGKWWVELYYDSDSDGELTEDDVMIEDYHSFGEVGIVTSNVASNTKDTVLISDPTHYWPFKIKAPVNISSLTFNVAEGLPNLDTEGETVSVLEGKILKGAAKNQLGNPADSIFLKLEFSDDEGTIYFFSGYRDNGFDQH